MDTAFQQNLDQAFRSGLDLSAETDLATLAFGEHRNWDSLGHMSLILALEETFGVTLADGDVLEIDSYESAAAVLKSELNGAASESETRGGS